MHTTTIHPRLAAPAVPADRPGSIVSHSPRIQPPAAAGRPVTSAASAQRVAPSLLPLGAIAAGFGLFGAAALAQAQSSPRAAPAPSAPVVTAAADAETTETGAPRIIVRGKLENDANSVRATSSTIGKGNQDLRDIPQSVTVITEKLLEDRRVDTLKSALHQTGGITFLAAEGGEEDVRLRGFSLSASGDIYVDSLRDPAFYDRDTFSYDRIELLRGSASMLFGRGSTGGVVNQVQKQAFLADASEVSLTAGTDSFVRLTGDFNVKTGAKSGLRVNVMKTNANAADNPGNRLNKAGIALSYRFGVGTDDEFSVSGYDLRNNNGINYGLPWLRVSSRQTTADPSVPIPGLDPKSSFGAASDYNAGGAAYGTLGWTHRFADSGTLKTAVRQGYYDRDQRASAIRFCQRTVSATTGVVSNPDCPTVLPGVDTINASTPMTRGVNNKVQNMHTTYAQSDYGNRLKWFGVDNDVLTGVDLAHEVFAGYATTLPAGVVLDKNTPRPTVGRPADGGGWVDESLRTKLQQAAFDARSIGVYGQDMVQVSETWKVLGGLRYDVFKGSYQSLQTATTGTPPPPPVGALTADRSRSDGLWSKRFGVLYQPSDTQSYHFSYGTSFNTSGDTYQYDLPGSNTPPEGSRNLELGAKLELADGRVSTRFALFQTIKFNERNRDSPTGTPITDYLLSGRRHAAGIDIDIAGRITAGWEVFGSYAWIPVASIDAGNPDGSTLTGELVGQRPSLTPRHSGTLWTTYQLTPALRMGAGINARSSQTPNRNPPGIVAPSFVTGDLLAEYTFSDTVSLKLNVLNVTNKYYADSLYTAHYIQGTPRSVQATLTTRF